MLEARRLASYRHAATGTESQERGMWEEGVLSQWRHKDAPGSIQTVRDASHISGSGIDRVTHYQRAMEVLKWHHIMEHLSARRAAQPRRIQRRRQCAEQAGGRGGGGCVALSPINTHGPSPSMGTEEQKGSNQY